MDDFFPIGEENGKVQGLKSKPSPQTQGNSRKKTQAGQWFHTALDRGQSCPKSPRRHRSWHQDCQMKPEGKKQAQKRSLTEGKGSEVGTSV